MNNIDEATGKLSADEMLKKYDVNIDRWPDTKKLIISAMEEYKTQSQQPTSPASINVEPVIWLKELVDIRNKLYNDLPVGELPETKVWDLIQMIKWHINDLDNFASRVEKYNQAQPQSSINVEQDKEFLPCPFCGNYPEWVNLAHPSGVAALRCHECQFSIQQDRKDKTLFYWNRRQPSPQSSINVDEDLNEAEIEISTMWCEVIHAISEADKKGIEVGEFIPTFLEANYDISRKAARVNVDEAAEKYAKNPGFTGLSTLEDAFKAGAEWQSQQPKKSLNI